MASYICPALHVERTSQMMQGMPCAGMDAEQPAHCASFKTDAKASLDHVNVTPALTSPSLAVVFRILPLSPVSPLLVSWSGTVPQLEDDPPYLRTLRIRI